MEIRDIILDPPAISPYDVAVLQDQRPHLSEAAPCDTPCTLEDIRAEFHREMQNLSVRISAIATRSTSPHKQRLSTRPCRGSPAPTRAKPPETRLCWYHRTFGEDARNCRTSLLGGRERRRGTGARRLETEHTDGTGSTHKRHYEEIQLHMRDGGTIPVVSTIRVLGMTIESNGANSTAISKILRQTANTSRLLKRVTNRRQGMKEESLIRVVHSFVICHVTYVAAFHDWYKAEKTKLDIIIRGAYKLALGLPNSTSTELLLQLELHNTLDELIEAQRRSHLERLTLTETGRHILTKLGITYHRQHGDKHPIPRDVQTWLHADPIPKNMHPEYNKKRRKARAASLIKAYGDTTGVPFVDAAEYQDGYRFAAATTVGGSLKRAASIVTQNAETAEEVAVALATLDPDCHTIVSDSRTAISNYIKGRISQQALRILHQSPHSTENQMTLVWFPAHAGDVHPHLTNLIEVAHSVARGLVNRAGDSAGAPAERDRLTSYNDLTKSFYLERRTFPTPHHKLNRAQATTLRLLQTNTWQAALRSSHLDDQLWATQQACEAAKRQDLDVPTWEA
ncbi:hypothetical protein HPB47_018424 [Ixodes persulcatus]|uniref:Uncharacterized protein n=1 Tax=Ixodes persulcatus TaxID=34615 RepID=A0AC60QNB0_IXOPE|nr:hypothetical protein HPB47_018424 [Ixodes persulcatus]